VWLRNVASGVYSPTDPGVKVGAAEAQKHGERVGAQFHDRHHGAGQLQLQRLFLRAPPPRVREAWVFSGFSARGLTLRKRSTCSI
jgi:hypothetical protein